MSFFSKVKNFDINRTDVGRGVTSVFGNKATGTDFTKGVTNESSDPALQKMVNNAATNEATPWEAGGDAHPVGSPWQSMLGSDGNIKSQYQLAAPDGIAAQKLDTHDLVLKNARGLETNTLGGDYGNVGVKSIMADATNRLSGINADPTAMNMLRQKATAQGPSAWAGLQKQSQGLAEQDALDASAKSNAGAMQNAMSSIAMRGGLSSGAGERAARDAAKNSALAAQGVRRGGMSDRLNIDIADEGQKNQLLQAMPAAELAWLQPSLQKANSLNSLQADEQGRTLTADMSNRDATMNKDIFNSQARTDASKFNIQNAQDVDKFNIGTIGDARKFDIGNALNANQFNTQMGQDTRKFNLGNTLSETDAGRQNDLSKFQTSMAAWAANKTADAQGKGGKK